METINIKFDEKQLEEVVKKVTEELKKEKANFYELSDTGHEEKKKKVQVDINDKKMSVFETLSVINVNDKKSKKNNLDYLSWAFAWSEVKKVRVKLSHRRSHSMG